MLLYDGQIFDEDSFSVHDDEEKDETKYVQKRGGDQ